MFKSKYISDTNDQHVQHRERQLIAKYGSNDEGPADCGDCAAYVEIEFNGKLLHGPLIWFLDGDLQKNLSDAKEYAAAFNEVWVLVEETVEAFSGGAL